MHILPCCLFAHLTHTHTHTHASVLRRIYYLFQCVRFLSLRPSFLYVFDAATVVNLHIFKSLTVLSIDECAVGKIAGLATIYSNLGTLTCARSLQQLRMLLAINNTNTNEVIILITHASSLLASFHVQMHAGMGGHSGGN